MKKISKLTKILFLFLSILSCLTPYASVLAESVSNTLTATHYEMKPLISFPAEFNVIKTTGGKYVYCMQYNKYVPNKSITYTKKSVISDNGLNYLLKEAYSAKNDSEYFIYKSAVWLYMIDKGLMNGTYNTLKTYYNTVKNSSK